MTATVLLIVAASSWRLTDMRAKPSRKSGETDFEAGAHPDRPDDASVETGASPNKPDTRIARIKRVFPTPRELTAGLLLTLIAFYLASNFEERLSKEQQLSQNVAFVRDVAISDSSAKPFGNLHLADTTLSYLNLSDAIFRESRLEDVDVQHVNLEGADFTATHLIRIDLGASNLRNVDFYRTTFDGVNMSRSDLRDADFTNVDGKGFPIVLWNTDARGADFTGARGLVLHARNADLRGADFTGANLESHSDFSGANLQGVKLTEEQLAEHDYVCYDDRTIWPEGFTPPVGRRHCLSRTDHSETLQEDGTLRVEAWWGNVRGIERLHIQLDRLFDDRSIR